jgi:hypothetical protein
MSNGFGMNEVGSACQSCPSAGEPVSSPADDDEDLERHWIEIELVGDDDQPIPGEQYCVTLPDGVQVFGFLDSKGRARLTGLESGGNCKVTFLDMDREAWESA